MAPSRGSVGGGLVATLTLTAALVANDPFMARGGAWGDVLPAPATCSATDDMATGGGWLLPDTRQKRTFGFQAGLGRNAPFPGHLVFVNHITGERLEGRIITYTPATGRTRLMTGEGRLNGAPATFELQVTDVTRDGRGDSFLLDILSPPRPPEGLLLGGGNIVVHPSCALPVTPGVAN